MRYSELIKILKEKGITFHSHGANHDIYYSPLTKRKVIIPRHKKEIPIGTLKSILKNAGLE